MVAQFQGSHEEDVDHIVFGAVDDIQAIISESRAMAALEGNDGHEERGLTAQDRIGIAAVVQKHAAELRAHLREKREWEAEAVPSNGKPRVLNEAVTRFRSKHGKAKQDQEEDEK